MPGRDIIVMGASAGGIGAIRTLLPLLPGDLPATLFLVLHRRPVDSETRRLLPVLAQNAELQVDLAEDGQSFGCGHVYVAPPDSHVLIGRGLIHLERSPAENHCRPSVDVLFRSAAFSYGSRVIGVLLSGMLGDGTAGMWQIWKRGGVTMVQDPREAAYPNMPQSALDNVPVHYTLPLIEIARALIALAGKEQNPPPITGPRKARIFIVADGNGRMTEMNLENHLSALGYEIVGSTSSGEEALEMASGSSPDVVLMDIHLAGAMSGVEAAKRLWGQYQIPVVYLTAHTDEKTLDAVRTSNPYGCIVKPYHPEQIHAALQLALDRYEQEGLATRELKRSVETRSIPEPSG